MYPESPEETQVIVGSMNTGYISDTARNRTHNLFRPKRERIPLGHNYSPDGRRSRRVYRIRVIEERSDILRGRGAAEPFRGVPTAVYLVLTTPSGAIKSVVPDPEPIRISGTLLVTHCKNGALYEHLKLNSEF